ncbi:MAG: electron transport complex subunit RsxC [Clostridia bacterium]|nr:electron transport complex subunit RsxC [Clostridia bacterium]
MLGFKFLGNTHVPHRKNTAAMPAVKMPPPKEVLLPMGGQIGAPSTPVVKAGDTVKVGQLVAEPAGYVSSAVHSPISGKVTKIEPYLCPNGKTVQAIRIQSDGEMTVSEEVVPPTVTDLDSFIEAVRKSGSIGLGGAGFPTAVKLDALKKGGIDTVVINAAECEPYITSDTRTMIDRIDAVKEGVLLFKSFAPTVTRIVFGIESNKAEAIASVREAMADVEGVCVTVLPSKYPQGAEKIIIHNTTGRIVPEGKLPADVGVIVINVSTLATIADYVKTGMPLVEKTLTLDGGAIANPMNVTVCVGTPIGEVIAFAGETKGEIGKVLYGGPMMGVPIRSLDEPVRKTTNAITVMTREESVKNDSTACIHCGRCVTACPMGLTPTAFSKALEIESKEDKVQRLEEYKINLCMECGCCSFVCPALRPLVQNNRLAKGVVREHHDHMKDKK